MRLVCEQEDCVGYRSQGENYFNSQSDGSVESGSDSEAWSSRETSESESCNDNEENRTIPPLTDNENPEEDENPKSFNKNNEVKVEGRNPNVQPSHATYKVKHVRKRRKNRAGKVHSDAMLSSSEDTTDSEQRMMKIRRISVRRITPFLSHL